MLNKEQQWRLVLAGHYNSLPDIDVVRQFENLSVQTTEVPPEQDPEVFSSLIVAFYSCFQNIMKTKRLEEANKDLKAEVELLRRANERFKSELLRSSKALESSSKRPAKFIRSPRSTNSAGSVGSRTRFGASKSSTKVDLVCQDLSF